jgi:hypothetical protein
MANSYLHIDEKWFGEAVTRDAEWYEAARAAAIRADACSVKQIVGLMASDGFKITIEDMDDWNADARCAFPCCFKNHLKIGLQGGGNEHA